MDLRCLRLLSVDKLWRQGSLLTDFLGWSLKERQPCWVRRDHSGEMAMALTANSALDFSLAASSWNSVQAHTNCLQTWQSSFGKQCSAFPSSLSTLSFEKGSLTEPQLSDHLDWLTISLQGLCLLSSLQGLGLQVCRTTRAGLRVVQTTPGLYLDVGNQA